MNSITPFLAWYEIPPFTMPKDKKEYEQRKKNISFYRTKEMSKRSLYKLRRKDTKKMPYVRCFWTWPFGHLWRDAGVYWECIYCGLKDSAITAFSKTVT